MIVKKGYGCCQPGARIAEVACEVWIDRTISVLGAEGEGDVS